MSTLDFLMLLVYPNLPVLTKPINRALTISSANELLKRFLPVKHEKTTMDSLMQ
jgi:hypothetical protein